MKPITLVLPYYENPGMLRIHFEAWARFPAQLRELLHVIVVDDCSPKHPAIERLSGAGAPVRGLLDLGIASFRLFRTGVDVRWNWLFCRNLGVAEARTNWVLLTDIDHLLTGKTLGRLTGKDHDGECVYRFARVDAPDMTPYKPHPNSWFLTRAMFDRIGGYDERFSGFYGTDADFRERVHATAKAVEMLPAALVRYPREVIADASTTTYGRKEPQDRANVPRIRAEREADPDPRPKRLTFPFEKLVDWGMGS